MFNWNAIVAGALSGSVFGSLATLFAPWVNWGVEKRRQRLDARRQRVAEWRRAVDESVDIGSFRETAAYASIRPHLRPTIVQEVESDSILIQLGGRGGGANNFSSKLYDEIRRIEKHWHLI